MATYTAVPIYTSGYSAVPYQQGADNYDASWYNGGNTGGTYISGYDVSGIGTFETEQEALDAIKKQEYMDSVSSGNVPITQTQKDFIVNPFDSDPQNRISDLIEARYEFLKEKSTPLESALFKYSSYDNPELYNNYVSEAIPKVQQGLQQERGLMDRTLAATGSSFSDQESVLRDKLTSLQSQESITQAANQIRTRLKDREQHIAFGSAPATTNMQGGI